MKTPSSNHKTSAEFFAHGYRLSGTYIVRNQLLADVIYDPTSDYILLHDAYLSPIMDPALISAYYKLTLMNKDNLDFVLTVNQRDGLRRDQHYGITGNRFTVYMTLPYFELTGDVFTMMKVFHPKSYLTTEVGAFMTLLDVTAHSTFNPTVSYQAGAALIKQSHLSFFGEKTTS